MLAIVKSIALNGMDAYPVSVEADVSNGLPSFDIVGLPETAVKESRERVKTALRNAGFVFPSKRIIINLAPADLKKDGTLFDLPIAIGLLLATEQIEFPYMAPHTYYIGELSLDGSVAPINGVLALVDGLGANVEEAHIFLPSGNIREGALSGRATVYPVEHLQQVARHLEREDELRIEPIFSSPKDFEFGDESYEGYLDMKDIKGQNAVKRALEIAAAGGHNLLMIGVPGSGKTMLARSLPTILPPLTRAEALETTRLYSMAGALGDAYMVKQRPFRTPHHTASAVSLIGGGRYVRPGEISMANHGVLFLDEIVEFPKSVLQVLRQPMEDKTVQVSRAQGTYHFPADFQLIATCNPCPCGYYGDPEKSCSCTMQQIKKYMDRLGGPLLDRIDLQVEVNRVAFEELHTKGAEEDSATMRERVVSARERQQQRYADLGFQTNAQLGRDRLDEICELDQSCKDVLARIFDRMHLSARAHDRILKVSRTIADLAGEERIATDHILEAVQYRALDRA